MSQGLSSFTLRRLLFALGALIVGVNLLSAIWDLRNSRAVVERNALRDFNNLTALLADQTARSLESVGILLHQAATDIPRDAGRDWQARADRLRDRISGFPRIRAILVLDRDGHVVVSTDDRTPIGEDYSSRQYFIRQRDAVIRGAFVSEPFLGRIEHHWAFALSERLADERGAFAGVVVAIVDVEYVDRLFRSIDLGGSGFVSLWNRDGGLVTRAPMREDLLGSMRQEAPPLVRNLPQAERYSGWVPHGPQGRQVLVSAAPVSDTPLIVVVGSSEDDVLAPWRRESERVIVRTVLTSAFMLALVWLAARELTRREAAERLAQEEQRRLHERLRQAEKMEAVGRLAGGIAHDFNNILAAIMGYAEMLLEDLRDGSPQQDHARSLLVGARRARGLVEQILTYSRTNAVPRRPLELGRIVRETLDVVRGSLPQGITLQGEIPSAPAVTAGDATQLHEVVMNLCTNAVQAMGDRGTLTVALHAVDLKESRSLSHGVLDAGPYLKLTVADTGAGMDSATMARIFEPFFTTKDVGRGTGLGLALIYGIVADARGAIAVASEPGRGSTFEIYLPRIDGQSLPLPESEPIIQRGHGERVLLVDDDEALLVMMTEMLRRLGYDPDPYSDPAAALASLRADPGAYDLVLTDEAMPGIPGATLARAAQDVREGIPVIVVTGRVDDALTRGGSESGVREILLKPVRSRDLAAALARHLAPR